MSTNFDSALSAAHAAAATQNHPAGTLYVVATPIGNLADISLRALHVLSLCDTLACEDTRHSQTLLRAYGIDKSSAHWLAVHQHNEAEAAEEVIRRLQAGQRVAYVSDAGTPAVSDPGARLAWQVQSASLRVVPLPGASSVTALLSACGTPAPDSSGFVFVGFLPSKATERSHAVEVLAQEPRTQVLLEAPHRIEALATALGVLGARPVTIGRELTKQFETFYRGSVLELAEQVKADAFAEKGEWALVLGPWEMAESSQSGAQTLNVDKLIEALLLEVPPKSVVKAVVAATGLPKNEIYTRVMAIKDGH